MRILLSAYACEPDKGSEPGVGWNWAIELGRLGHEVHVITRANNRDSITKEMKTSQIRNLHFYYYDIPGWLKWWKKGKRGVHLYYFLWQIGIYFVGKQLLSRIEFDIIHHVTFVSIRQPSFLGLLGVPFIFGPVAGGERAPFRLRKSFPIRGWLVDLLRDLANQWVRFSPMMWLTFSKATKIYVTSEETRRLIPKKFQKKTTIQLAITTDGQSKKVIELVGHIENLRVLYVGQLLYWKGVHLALRSFALFLTHYPESRFTILGKGPDKSWLKSVSVELGIDHAVEWLEWLPRCELDNVYQKHSAFLFPSLHDSGGMVVLEAMMNGLPIVCLDLGGPGVTVDDNCGYKINVKGRTETEVVADLSDALVCLFETVGRQQRQLADGALKRVHHFSRSSIIQTIYSDENSK